MKNYNLQVPLPRNIAQKYTPHFQLQRYEIIEKTSPATLHLCR